MMLMVDDVRMPTMTGAMRTRTISKLRQHAFELRKAMEAKLKELRGCPGEDPGARR